MARTTDQDFSAGAHRVPLSISGLPSGSYFYELKAPGFSGRGKLLIVN